MGTTEFAASDTTEARVIRLWRYPVKSMLGEECGYLDVDERGAKGDRLFAVRDADGKFGSGKTTRRFRKIDGLLGFRAAYEHLARSVRTGTFCVYEPDQPVRWSL